MDGDCKGFLFEALQIIHQNRSKARIEISKKNGLGNILYMDTLFFNAGELIDIKSQNPNIAHMREKLVELYEKRDKVKELEVMFGEESTFDQGIKYVTYQFEVAIADYLFKEINSPNTFRAYNNSFSIENNIHASLQNIILGLAVKKDEFDKQAQ